MKRLPVLLILLLLSAFNTGSMYYASAAGTSYTLRDQYVTDDGGTLRLGSASTRKYLAFFLVPGSTNTRTKHEGYMKKTGSPTFNMTVEYWTSVSSKPGVKIGTGSASVAASAQSTSLAYVAFAGGFSAGVTNGTECWQVYICDATQDTSNCIKIQYDSSESYPGHFEAYDSSDGVTWNSVANSVGMMKSYSTP